MIDRELYLNLTLAEANRIELLSTL